MISPRDENRRCATPSEKVAAFNALKRQDYGKLLSFARYMAQSFRGRIIDADAEDLLQEALTRALDEQNIRKWYPEDVSFDRFLAGCIRSIASGWKKASVNTESADELPSSERHDEQVEAVIALAKIREVLEARPHAAEIFDLKCQGMSGKQIQQTLGINEKIYGAAVKWTGRVLRLEGYRK